MDKPKQLRELLSRNQLLVTAGAYDALSARVIEKAGLKLAFMSGFGVEASLLGRPDVGLLTLTEVVSQARNMANAVNVPLLADAEAGYGGFLNIRRTVREFETAGVAGIILEDQSDPVMCGSIREHKRIISMEEMVAKLRCALDARQNPDFLICARTDSEIISVQEQVRRCNAYAEVGADLVTPIVIPKTCKQFQLIARAVDAPLLLFLTAKAEVTPADLEEIGIRGIVVYPVEMLFAATKALVDLAHEISSQGTVRETLGRLQAPDYSEFFEFVELRDLVELEQSYASMVHINEPLSGGRAAG